MLRRVVVGLGVTPLHSPLHSSTHYPLHRASSSCFSSLTSCHGTFCSTLALKSLHHNIIGPPSSISISTSQHHLHTSPSHHLHTSPSHHLHTSPSHHLHTSPSHHLHTSPGLSQYDEEIFSDHVRVRGGTVYLDVKRSEGGRQYLKLTEHSQELRRRRTGRGAKSFVTVPLADVPALAEALAVVAEGGGERRFALGTESLVVTGQAKVVTVVKETVGGERLVHVPARTVSIPLAAAGKVGEVLEAVVALEQAPAAITVSRHEASAIVGRRGATIDMIRKESGARVKMTGGKGDAMRQLLVSGDKEAIRRAKELVVEVLNYRQVEVTPEEKGVLLGGGGGKVEVLGVEERSGAVVEVVRGDQPKLLVYGTTEAKEKAMELIREVVKDLKVDMEPNNAAES